MIRCAIIWTGNIAWLYDVLNPNSIFTHAWAIKKNPLLNLEAAYNPIKKDLNLFLKHYKIESVFTDFEKFLNYIDNFDIVSICSPTEFHFEQLKKLINSNVKIIIVEKPPVLNLEEFNQIIKKNKKKKKQIIVNITRHYDNTYKKVANEYVWKLWKITYIKCNYEKWFFHNCIHFLDLMNHFLYLNFNKVKIIDKYETYKNDISWDIRLYSWDIVCDCINFNKSKYTIFEIEIFFEKWKISILEDWKSISIAWIKEDKKFKGDFYLDSKPIIIETEFYKCMENLYKNVINNINNKEEFTLKLEDTLPYYKIQKKLLSLTK